MSSIAAAIQVHIRGAVLFFKAILSPFDISDSSSDDKEAKLVSYLPEQL